MSADQCLSADLFLRSGDHAATRTTNEKLGDIQSIRDTVGVTGTQGVSQGAAINKAIDAAAASSSYTTLFIPDGVYDIETPLILKPGVTIQATKNAQMRCVAPMSAMLQTPSETCVFDVGVSGGRWLCNDNSDGGFDVKWFQRFKLFSVYVDRFRYFGARFGLPGTQYSSFEAELWDVNTFRSAGMVAGGSKAVHFRSATDSTLIKCVLVGGESGFYTETGGHHLYNVHCWVGGATGKMKVGFWDRAGSNTYIDCYADTPWEDGFRLEFGLNTLLACRAFINQVYDQGGVPRQNDGIASGIKFYTPNPGSSIRDFKCAGISPSYRFYADIDTSSITADGSIEIVGTQSNNCINQASTIISKVGVIERRLTGVTPAVPGQVVTVQHGCKLPNGAGRMPKVISLVPRGAGQIYMPIDPDESSVYVASTVASQMFDVYAG